MKISRIRELPGQQLCLLLLCVTTLLSACEKSPSAHDEASADFTDSRADNTSVARSADRDAFFGDLHVHTMYSFDAFIFGTTSSPDDAYEFAKGGSITHPGGFEMQLKTPLDFYGVSDHGFYLGAIRAMADPASKLSELDIAQGMDELDSGQSRLEKFAEILAYIRSENWQDLLDHDTFKNAWDDIVDAANRHNDPGNFTTFIAYEYTSSLADFENLHRNVVFKGAKAPELPFTRLDSLNPEDLWTWMDQQRSQGFESIAIPHNSNGSNGEMLKLATFDGGAMTTQYAEQRMRNEPLIEISQVKGTSETHPALSPNDEWADFEIMPYRIASTESSSIDGSYLRQALGRGLKLREEEGFNPFKFGFVGSSDTHNATYAGPEDDYWSKIGLVDDEAAERGSVPMGEGDTYSDSYYNTWSAAGLAGVWAEANTRDDIYDAFRRKETFGTSGTRIKVRFFAGHDMPDLASPNLIAQSYAAGVPMGSDLIAEASRSPDFIAWASRDANSAGLQRLQVVKSVLRGGEITEQVFDVACADGAEPDATTYRCPVSGASVDLTNCSYDASAGATELNAKWIDPEYSAAERAVYYVRVLENPTCRWSTWDAIRAGVAPRVDLHPTIQERAWSSPIWVEPAG